MRGLGRCSWLSKMEVERLIWGSCRTSGEARCLEERVFDRLSDFGRRQEEIRDEAECWHGELLGRQNEGFARIESIQNELMSRQDEIVRVQRQLLDLYMHSPPPPGLGPSKS
ncbi:uncharacterized protein A4U43_C06F15720 [Asparagus officinalis]|uniref:Uncharacterized protein n=1 Tax=Asparagus officinalis TaxID=4686 RepID=A0A5P1ERA7_ASPOF|nr:uncharacterized protein A4U43_C06F15720 [Asparagus officinalis]